jgi:S1-C subfamily serine protease
MFSLFWRKVPMTRLFVLSVAFVLLFRPPVAAPASELIGLAKAVSPSVVHLQVQRNDGTVSSGTGFFVSSEGSIVTNYHVIRGAKGVTITTADKITINGLGVLAANEERDLALILAEPGYYYAPLALATTGESPQVGERIVLVGGPLGLAGTLSEGIVSAVRTTAEVRRSDADEKNYTLLQHTAPMSLGSSGSPVINLSGAVVGVAVSQYRFGQNLNFAIPIANVHDLLRSVSPDMDVKQFKGELPIGLKDAIVIVLTVLFLAILSISFWRKKRQRSKQEKGELIHGPWD